MLCHQMENRMNASDPLKRVLVSAHDVEYSRLLCARLSQHMFKITGEAKNGLETIYLFVENRPDITLLDLETPLGGGLTSLRFLRELDPISHIVILAPEELSFHRETAMKLGATKFLIKEPLYKPQLIETLKNIGWWERTSQVKKTIEKAKQILAKIPTPFQNTPYKPLVQHGGKRVLICDDEPIMRRLLRARLEKFDYEITGEAECGLQAINYFVQQRPDIVLLDISMEMGEGLTTLRFMREIDPHTRIVMITGKNTFHIINTAKNLGADDYLIKDSINQIRFLEALGAPPSMIESVNKSDVY